MSDNSDRFHVCETELWGYNSGLWDTICKLSTCFISVLSADKLAPHGASSSADDTLTNKLNN